MPPFFEGERIRKIDLIEAVCVVIMGLVVAAVMIVSPGTASPVYIAQNDPAQFAMTSPAGHCWYFPSSAKEDYSKMYDIPAEKYGDSYSCDLSSAQTANLPEGNYKLVYVYPVRLDTNTIPPSYLSDLSWNRSTSTIVSLFGTVYYESGKQPYMVMADLLSAVNQSRLDHSDTYDIVIQPPMLSITRNEGEGWDFINISGITNLADGTKVRIEIDEFDRTLDKDKEIAKYYSFTNYTEVVRLYTDRDGTWGYSMHLPIQEMTPGWHTATVYAGGLVSSVRFPIYQAFTPEPTPRQYINYFGNGSMKPDVVTVKVVEIQTTYVDRWHTATPTPPITDALGGTIPYPYKSGSIIPEWVGIVGMFALAGIILVRDRK
jgi:hypothetical protein